MADSYKVPNNNETKKTMNQESSSSVSSNNKPPKHPNAKGYNPNLRATIQKPKQKINKEAAKKGIVTAVNAMTYGRGGGFAKRYLETEEGQEILERAAQESSNPAEATKMAAKEIAKKQIGRTAFITILSVLSLIVIIILPIAILFGKNPDVGMGALGEENTDFIELREKIDEVKAKYRSKYGVTIDGNLILATLVAYQESEAYTEESQNETETIVETNETTGTVTVREVSVMISKIELLAKYQIMTTADGSCNSSTIRQIASNDDNGVLDQLKSPSDREKNYKCVPGTEINQYELSIERGNYSDNNSGGVYYWNLIDGDFITDYYADYIPSANDDSNNEKKAKEIRKIVEDIYDYYETLEKEASMCSVVYASCPGIKVNGIDETFDLDTYVAGVLYAEFHTAINNEEMGKAAAIIVRSYTLAHTNNCTKTIGSSSYEQNFIQANSGTIDLETYRGYVDATAGQVMTDDDGVVLAVYFAMTQGNCDSVTGGMCNKRLYYRYQSGGTHHISVPYNALPAGTLGEHASGLAVWAAAYQAEHLGWNYEQILKEYYGPNMTISSLETSSGANSICGSSDEGGLSVADASGFRARTAMPTSDNKFYFSNLNLSYASGYTGQCTWYAFGRANETLAGANSDLKWRHAPNAGVWYDYNLSDGSKGFKSSRDPYKPKAGAIIVWKQAGRPGHVGFVEKVNSDRTIDYSEANVSAVKSATNPYGWRYNSHVSLDQIKNMWSGSGYSFVGYIYMIE